MSEKEKELKRQLDELKSAVKKFVDKANDNTASLWKPDMSETEDCLVLFPCAFSSEPEDEENVKEFDGVHYEIVKLEELIK